MNTDERREYHVDINVKLYNLLAAEHGTDRVETILDTKKNE